MAQYTDVTVLLDRSGSMADIKDAMESAFSEFIQQHRAVPSTRLTLIQFDSVNPQEVVYSATPIGDAKALTLEPRNMTPLLDALCRAIDDTGERLKSMSDPDRPDQVLFVIITDGLENASRKHDRADVKARIDQQQGVYKWQFVFLGANQDAIAEAAKIGITQDDALEYAAVPDGAMAAGAAFVSNSLKYANRTSARAGSFSAPQRVGAMAGRKPTR